MRKRKTKKRGKPFILIKAPKTRMIPLLTNETLNRIGETMGKQFKTGYQECSDREKKRIFSMSDRENTKGFFVSKTTEVQIKRLAIT